MFFDCCCCFIEFRQRGTGRERETSISCLLYTPHLEIKPTTFWCPGLRSNQLSHPARARSQSSTVPPTSSYFSKTLSTHLKGLDARILTGFQTKTCTWMSMVALTTVAPNVYQQMNEKTKHGISIQWNIVQPQKGRRHGYCNNTTWEP